MDYLVHLEVDERVATAELTVAPGQVVVAIVPVIETELIPALSQLAERVQRLAVVLLEGFVPGEIPHEFLSRLKGSNLDIVSCSRGNLEAAVKKLGNSLFFTGKLPTTVG